MQVFLGGVFTAIFIGLALFVIIKRKLDKKKK